MQLFQELPLENKSSERHILEQFQTDPLIFYLQMMPGMSKILVFDQENLVSGLLRARQSYSTHERGPTPNS